MVLKSFKQSGHFPSLLSAFLYFDVSFMIWVLCGAVSLYITQDFGLTDSQKATMVALPLLGGAILRIPMGILSDRIGCKKTGIIGMIITILPLLWGWLGGTSLSELHAIGLLLGVAGASFGVALPLAGRWYPPQYQGMAMGIAGAGNSGTAIATFFGPKIAEMYGWHSVFGLAIIPLLLILISFLFMAKDSPNQPEPKKLSEYLSVFRYSDTWWFCLFYAITFGGFSGLASYLGIFFYDIYGDKAIAGGLSMIQIGYLVTVTVVAGSLFRPIGGYVADRIGGMKFLQYLFACISICSFLVTLMPSSFLVMLMITSIMMACLGMGNGSVFQIVPQRFKDEIGVITGIVGAAGGFGGFLLPNYILGPLKQATGSHVAGFITLACIGLVVTLVFYSVSRSWKKSWATVESGVKF